MKRVTQFEVVPVAEALRCAMKNAAKAVRLSGRKDERYAVATPKNPRTPETQAIRRGSR